MEVLVGCGGPDFGGTDGGARITFISRVATARTLARKRMRANAVKNKQRAIHNEVARCVQTVHSRTVRASQWWRMAIQPRTNQRRSRLTYGASRGRREDWRPQWVSPAVEALAADATGIRSACGGVSKHSKYNRKAGGIAEGRVTQRVAGCRQAVPKGTSYFLNGRFRSSVARSIFAIACLKLLLSSVISTPHEHLKRLLCIIHPTVFSVFVQQRCAGRAAASFAGAGVPRGAEEVSGVGRQGRTASATGGAASDSRLRAPVAICTPHNHVMRYKKVNAPVSEHNARHAGKVL